MSYTEQAGRKLVPCGGFPAVATSGDLLLVTSAGEHRGTPARRDLPVPAPSHKLVRETRVRA